jgi:hypothetical protein
MLKRLVIAAFGIAFLSAISPNGQAREQKEKGQSVPEPSITIVDNSIRQNDQSRPDPKSPEPHAGIKWGDAATWALVLIGGITAWAVWIQAKESANATKTMRDSIQGQERAVQTTINAERPWLSVQFKKSVGPSGGFIVHARNEGRNAARILDAPIACLVRKDVGDLPIPPPYGAESWIKDRILVPTKSVDILWFDQRMLRRWVEIEGKFPESRQDGDIYIFGRVRYQNLVDPHAKVVHETRWIGIYQFPVGERDDSIFQIEGIGVSPEYDKYT